MLRCATIQAIYLQLLQKIYRQLYITENYCIFGCNLLMSTREILANTYRNKNYCDVLQN